MNKIPDREMCISEVSHGEIYISEVFSNGVNRHSPLVYSYKFKKSHWCVNRKGVKHREFFI